MQYLWVAAFRRGKWSFRTPCPALNLSRAAVGQVYSMCANFFLSSLMQSNSWEVYCFCTDGSNTSSLLSTTASRDEVNGNHLLPAVFSVGQGVSWLVMETRWRVLGKTIRGLYFSSPVTVGAVI